MLGKYFENKIDNKAKLGCSPTGFTNDRLLYKWLEHVTEQVQVRGQLRLSCID